MSAIQTNANSTLCVRCQSILQLDTEPRFLDNQFAPLVETTLSHHDSDTSFLDAIKGNCFICSRLTYMFPANHEAQGGPVTRAQIFKTGNGEYDVSIYMTIGVGGHLGRVTYFTATRVADSMALNVPTNQHHEMVSKWVTECQAGIGKHANCHRSRSTRGMVRTSQKLCVIQLMVDQDSNDILCRLQDLNDTEQVLLNLRYVTVSQHDESSQDHSFIAELKKNLSSWRTVTELPPWLHQAAKAAVAVSISYLWEPILCLDHDGASVCTAEMYAGGAFNIAHLPDSTSDLEGRFDTDQYGRHHQDAIPLIRPSWAPQHLLALYQRTLFRDPVVNSPLWRVPLFHQALLLSPATLFIIEGKQQHMWWHCTSGEIYSDAVATGVTIDHNINPKDDSASPQIRMVGTHTMDIQILLLQMLQDSFPVMQEYKSLEQQLASLWTSVAMAYSQTEDDDKEQKLLDTAGLIRKLYLEAGNGNEDDEMSRAAVTYAYGVWSSGLIYLLAWHGDPLLQEQLPQSRRRTHAINTTSADSGERTLPSWSWLSSHSPITFEFLITSGAAGLMAPYLDPIQAHVLPVATATFELINDGESSPPTRIYVCGRLIEVNMDVYEETGGLQLSNNCGYAGVHFDCGDEESRVLQSKAQGKQQGKQQVGTYVVWPIFSQVDDLERVESRGLILRKVEADSPALSVYVRCGWFRYSSEEQDQEQIQSGDRPSKAFLELAQGDTSMHQEFAIV